ncbi:uncharacterized protein M6B38_198270 [Iris pallida]|uniref:CCT domain-containing protein n=1 Tax=Iris pallida TaxID=29817 RepID=A0AAX6EBX3_IRIPA|nr:uncharacterized protein M6B38_198270 [Iris pallida]
MYADAGLTFPLLQSYTTREVSPATTAYHDQLHLSFTNQQQQEELLTSFRTDDLSTDLPMASLLRTSSVSEYDLGGEGDLFKAPEPIIEEPVLALDPMSAAMTIISNGEDVISGTIKAADMETIQNEHLKDVFYECKKDLLEKCVIDESFPELQDVKLPVPQTEEVHGSERGRLVAEGRMLKSVSSGCLTSMEWISGCTMRPNFLDFHGMDFETAFGLRRAYSEGDIQALGITNRNLANTSSVHASFERQLTISELKTEERRQKLSRYRKKKTKRNFGRKIKYACRKALADSQPRVRGRFAKTEECEASKPLK